MRPIDVVRRLCPHAKPSYVAAFENGDALFLRYGITTVDRLAHFLAQCFHETGGLTIERESGNYHADRILEIFGEGHHSAAVTPAEAVRLAGDGPALFDRVYGLGNPHKAHELGNTRPGDGWKYRGGGILQTTGRGKYARMGQKCGVNFELFPEEVLSAQHALKPALAEWGEGHLSDAADRDDIVAITKKINGGLNGLDSRRQWLAHIKLILNSVELKPAPAPAPAPAPTPAPSPVHPKDVAIGGTLVAAIAAALAAHKIEIVVGVAIAGIAIALAIHFLWKKKD